MRSAPSLVALRRDKRRLEQEVEILKRASAHFAPENVMVIHPMVAELAADQVPVATARRVLQVSTSGCMLTQNGSKAGADGRTGHAVRLPV